MLWPDGREAWYGVVGNVFSQGRGLTHLCDSVSAMLDQLQTRWKELEPHQRLAAGQLVRFILAGLLNTVVGYLIYATGVVAGLPPSIALVGAFAFALIFNYFTHARMVFRRSGRVIFIRFVVAYVALYFINLALLHLAIRFGAGPLLAQALVVPFVVICTFLVFKLAVFREDQNGGG
jgi:putative flippase GtrA